jgi:hypothetical protein
MFSAEDRLLAEGRDVDLLDGVPRQNPGSGTGSGSAPDPAADLRSGSEPVASGHGLEPEDPPSADRKLPLLATVLLADLAVAIVALVVLVIIGVREVGGDATLGERQTVHAEDLVVFFVGGALFVGVAYLLYRARQNRVAVVQAVVAAVVLGLGIFAAVNGNPSASSDISPAVPDDSPSQIVSTAPVS